MKGTDDGFHRREAVSDDGFAAGKQPTADPDSRARGANGGKHDTSGGAGAYLAPISADDQAPMAIGYVRVSTDEQLISGAGLAAQRAAIEAEVERRGWQLLAIAEDAGFSGRDLRRPGIQTALEALRSKEASALVIAKVDRLSRSMLDFAALMDRSTKEGWALVALDLGVDTSSASGEALAHLLADFSQFERRLIGQRTKDALAAKRAQGVRLGRPRLVPDAIVERMFRERLSGATLREIGAGLDRDGIPTAQGGRSWHPATVRDALRAYQLRAAEDEHRASSIGADAMTRGTG